MSVAVFGVAVAAAVAGVSRWGALLLGVVSVVVELASLPMVLFEVQ